MPKRTIEGMREALAPPPGLSDHQRLELQQCIDRNEADDYTLARKMLTKQTHQDAERAERGGLG